MDPHGLGSQSQPGLLLLVPRELSASHSSFREAGRATKGALKASLAAPQAFSYQLQRKAWDRMLEVGACNPQVGGVAPKRLYSCEKAPQRNNPWLQA